MKWFNNLGLSDTMLQCDPKLSLINLGQHVKAKQQERTVFRSPPRRSHQNSGTVENFPNKYRDWCARYAASSIVAHSAIQRWIFTVAGLSCSGGLCCGQLLGSGESVLAEFPKVGNRCVGRVVDWTEGSLRSVVKAPQKQFYVSFFLTPQLQSCLLKHRWRYRKKAYTGKGAHATIRKMWEEMLWTHAHVLAEQQEWTSAEKQMTNPCLGKKTDRSHSTAREREESRSITNLPGRD